MYLPFSDHTDKNMSQILCLDFVPQGSEYDFCICAEVRKQNNDDMIFSSKDNKRPL